MSVTVADCLALPSFRDATVAGGAAGLNKIVASVTVLEYAKVSLLDEFLFVGNELVISAFATAKDDVGLQCDVIRQIYNYGTVAFALYYLGVIVPKLDKRLIAVADELSMPLIIMPPRNMKFRYSTAIMEIAEMILYDTLHEKYFVPTIIERVAQFPESQRNLDNVLRILSDRFHISIIITDEQICLVSKAFWPGVNDFDTERFIEMVGKDMTSFHNEKNIEMYGSTFSVFYNAIYVSRNQKMYIFTVMEKDNQPIEALDKNILMQISESIQLIVSMQSYSDWSQSTNQLVNAIMNKDVYWTTKIAGQSGFDIKSIDNMWIMIMSKITAKKRAELLTTNRMLQVKDFLSYRFKTAIVGSYEESIICLMSESSDSETGESAPYEFMNEIYACEDMLLLSFSNIKTLTDIRKAYNEAHEGWYPLKAIYKNRSIFFRQELNFAIQCLRIIEQEGNPMKENTAILDPLISTSGAQESIETLSVFLLDAGGSIAEAAGLMHIHPNTVKYRLKEIKKKLQADILKLPDAYKFYLAVALLRLNEAI